MVGFLFGSLLRPAFDPMGKCGDSSMKAVAGPDVIGVDVAFRGLRCGVEPFPFGEIGIRLVGRNAIGSDIGEVPESRFQLGAGLRSWGSLSKEPRPMSLMFGCGTIVEQRERYIDSLKEQCPGAVGLRCALAGPGVGAS